MNIWAESHLATPLPVVLTGTNKKKKKEPIVETRSSELGAQASSKHWRQEAGGQDGLPGIPCESYTIITSHVETAGWLFFFHLLYIIF